MGITPEEFNKAKALFETALTQEPSQRAAFLAQNCPDDGLRHEVEKLLINLQEAGSFLSSPVLHPQIATLNQISKVRAEDESPSVGAVLEDSLSTGTGEGTDDPLIGRRFGAYELRRRVGKGGMAAVFLAVRADGEYRRQVAIKLVLPGLERDEVLSRFRKERQTLAGLDHPNIVKLLDGGSTLEGLPYLVMDYVEGSPIDQYCDSHKLSVEQRLRLIGKVCEAVQHAHQKLVIHRDLKPGNILVTAAGEPKLLDFGIAKVLEPKAELLALTQTAGRCMTPAYASPEQVRAKSVTAATDIYSLGVVLYELLTGHRPYRLKEHTASEMERAICEQEPENPSTAVNRVESETSSDGTTVIRTPEAVSETREGHPERLRRQLRGDLDNIVLKALQKEPERRYHSVEEFSRDIDRHLRRLPVKARRSTLAYRAARLVQRHKIEASATSVVLFVLSAAAWSTFQPLSHRDRTPRSPSTQIQSIAVLPLTNLSGDPGQEYFADGMTDALITELGQVGPLRVISQASSVQYKQTRKSLREIARELHVDGIVEGAVQRSGNRVRINTQLIHGSTDKHLWANSYERDVRDVFQLERDVAGDIARQVQARVTTEKRAPPAQPRPVNPAALEAYLQGNYHMHRSGRGFGDEEMILARESFRRAIDVEPGFAPAYVGLSEAHRNMLWNTAEDLNIGKTALERAVELDPNLSNAWGELADMKCEVWDWAGAEHDYRRALALNPNNGDVHERFGWLLDALGRLDEGWNEAVIAQQVDPNQEHLGAALYTRHEYDQMIQHVMPTLEADPNAAGLTYELFQAYAGKGMYKEALEQAERTFEQMGFQESAAKLREALAASGASGYKGAMRKLAEEHEHLQAAKKLFIPVHTASFYAAAGDKERAFYWLEQAFKYRGPGNGPPFVFLNREPLLEPLRSDPRYKDLLARVGLPP